MIGAAMCEKCDGFAERLNLEFPREYLDIVRQLIDIVKQRTFTLVRADCELEEMFNTPWPGDIIFHEAQCSNCGRRFTLFADTYHGNASWHTSDGDLPPPFLVRS